MIRVVPLVLVVFLAPFVIYGLFLWFAGKASTLEEVMRQLPVVPLLAVGVVALLALVFYLTTYEPHRMALAATPAVPAVGAVLPA